MPRLTLAILIASSFVQQGTEHPCFGIPRRAYLRLSGRDGPPRGFALIPYPPRARRGLYGPTGLKCTLQRTSGVFSPWCRSRAVETQGRRSATAYRRQTRR